MNVVPDELAEVVHRAAAGTAEYPVDLSGIERRWRRRRRRRVVACAAGVAVLAAASLAAIPVINARPGPDRPPVVAADPAPQRLMVGGGTWSPMNKDVTDGNVLDRRGATEILPDGTVVQWPLPNLDVSYQVIGLPDDRLAVLDFATTSRGRTTPPPLTLRVVSSTGAVQAVVPVGTGDTKLVAATPETAYLWRSEGIVAYTLATGARRVLVPADKLGVKPLSGPAADADLLGDRVVVTVVSGTACKLRVIDLRGGHVADHPVTRRACDGTGLLRISPDGGLAAVTYKPSTGAQRVAVIDLTTGAPRVDALIENPGGDDRAGPAGLAWQGSTRLRVALLVSPPDLDRTYYREDLVRQQLVEVG
jgi:hypothetical protein